MTDTSATSPPLPSPPARRALITGAAGFVGSNLAMRLLREGWDVVGVDNLSQGVALNLESAIDHPRFRFVLLDIRDAQGLNDATRGCSHVVHLAAYKIPRYSDALDTLLVNSEGSHQVFRSAIDNQCTVIAASTSDVYGKNPEIPFREESALVVGPPTVRRWSYAISKMFEEQLLYAYHERCGLPFAIIRFFGMYGPNQNLTWWGGPQSVFINAALENETIPIHGDGMQTRGFTHIDDAVDGIVRCLDAPQPLNSVFNIGGVEETTIVSLANLIWELVRGDEAPRLEFVPYETFGNYEDVRRRMPDLAKSRRVLGYEPRVGLREGLAETIRWQVERRERLKTGLNDVLERRLRGR